MTQKPDKKPLLKGRSVPLYVRGDDDNFSLYGLLNWSDELEVELTNHTVVDDQMREHRLARVTTSTGGSNGKYISYDVALEQQS